MRVSREQYLLSLRRFRAVMDYLEDHLDDEHINLNRLAEVASLSRFHFERMYANGIQETPMATVRRLRLTRARRALQEGTSFSVTDLAMHAGYNSVAAFSRAFSRAFGQPPSQIVGENKVLHPEPRLDFVSLPAVPIVRQPFTGRAAEVFGAGDEFSWVVARSGTRHWRHWVVHPDGWIDPAQRPETWVRMWHCAPSAGCVQNVPGAESGHLPLGTYARFVFVGKQSMNVPKLMARIATEKNWQAADGPMLRHFPNVQHFTPVSERITHFYIAVAPR